MASAGVVARGPVRPTLPNGEPSYYLPGSNVADPNYARKKQAWDQSREAYAKMSTQAGNEITNIVSAGNHGGPVAMSYTDPRTGMRYDYNPGSGGGSRGAGGSGGGDVDVNALWQKSGVIQPPPPMPVPPQVPHVSLADTSAAQAAEFSKAKDRVGKIGRASLDAFAGAMRERGISGSGIEGEGIGERVDQASGALGDVVNNQAIDALKRRYAIDDENYQGDIGQRGQDIGIGQSNANRALQALQMRANLHNTLMSLAARNSGRVY